MPHPTLTPEYVQRRIRQVQYSITGKVTICVLTDMNGYQIIGTSGVVHLPDFNADLGEQYALEDAKTKHWAFVAFLEQQRDYEHAFQNGKIHFDDLENVIEEVQQPTKMSQRNLL